METIPALMEREERATREAARRLPHGPGIVHVIGGGQVKGEIRLTNTLVICDLYGPDEYGATTRVFPWATVRSVDFE